jgi:hypothetical protein
MLKKAEIDRLDLFDVLLDHFEEVNALGATPIENLRLIDNELIFLAQVREDDVERINRLMERALAVRAGLMKTIQ